MKVHVQLVFSLSFFILQLQSFLGLLPLMFRCFPEAFIPQVYMQSLRSCTYNILPSWGEVLSEENTGYVLNSNIKQS